MERGKRYVSSLTRKDLDELADAANAYGGDGVNVGHTPDGLEISIDKMQLERFIRVVMQGGHLQ